MNVFLVPFLSGSVLPLQALCDCRNTLESRVDIRVELVLTATQLFTILLL